VRLVVVAFVVLLAGCSSAPPPGDDASPSITPSSGSVDPAACTGHRHATFGVAIPDANGTLQRLDLAAPRTSQGRAYYQLGIAPRMTVAVHMHQNGPEAGDPEEQVSQMHYERDACATVAQSLHVLDVEASAARLQVGGLHAAKGNWTTDGEQAVRVYLQRPVTTDDACVWIWQAVDAAQGLAHVVGNGESFLALFGQPSEADLSALESGIPPPMGRPTTTCP
jgi:hypothetical protein